MRTRIRTRMRTRRPGIYVEAEAEV
jgi:hypothetical protein